MTKNLYLGFQFSVLGPELLDGGLVLGGSPHGVLEIVDSIARLIRLLNETDHKLRKMNKQ